MGLGKEHDEQPCFSDIGHDEYDTFESVDELQHKKRVRRMIEEKLEQKRLREALEDEFEADFDWDDLEK